MWFLQVLAGEADVSTITYFAPILVFLLVFAVMFALLRKTDFFSDNPYIQVFTSLIIAVIFVIAGSVRQVVIDVIPWFAVLLVVLFMMLAIAGFIGKSDIVGKGVGWGFIILLIIIFLVSGIKVFSGVLWPYLPGPSFGTGGDPQVLTFLDWFYSPRVLGAALLVVAAAVTSWVLVKFGSK